MTDRIVKKADRAINGLSPTNDTFIVVQKKKKNLLIGFNHSYQQFFVFHFILHFSHLFRLTISLSMYYFLISIDDRMTIHMQENFS